MTSGRAVVTGAGSGIGAAIAARLMTAGWHVTGVGRREAGDVPPGMEWVRADLADEHCLDALADRLTGLDALVHAAGLQATGRVGSLEPGVGERMWRLHVQGVTLLANRAVATMRDGGRILLIGSRTAAGVPGKSQYAATKAALVALARSWAAELVDRRICVNVLAPGPTRTPMLDAPERCATPAKMPPLGRFIEPDEVAQFAQFLLGPGGAMVTGQHLVMCGGASLG